MKSRRTERTKWVVCVNNAGYESSLERRKIYRSLRDREAEAEKLLRVIDESGEDYLYPARYFKSIALAPSVRRALRP